MDEWIVTGAYFERFSPASRQAMEKSNLSDFFLVALERALLPTSMTFSSPSTGAAATSIRGRQNTMSIHECHTRSTHGPACKV